jgi:hypothetical protein
MLYAKKFTKPKNIKPDKIAAAGTVITQAAIIVIK